MEDLHIVYDAQGKPRYDTVSEKGTTARKKAESKTGKTWKQLEALKWSCLNVDIIIKLRG